MLSRDRTKVKAQIFILRQLEQLGRGEFEPALKRVIPLLEDQRQVERAKKYLANE